MKILALVITVFLIASCTNSVEIKDKNFGEEINDAYIRTTRVEINGDANEDDKAFEKPKPTINIISPKNGQSINGSDIAIELEAMNFTDEDLIATNTGYFSVWLDSEKKVINKNKISFYNISSGKHSITAELLDSNYSSLSP